MFLWPCVKVEKTNEKKKTRGPKWSTRAGKMALQNANKIKGYKSIIIGFPRIISTASTTIIAERSLRERDVVRVFSAVVVHVSLVSYHKLRTDFVRMRPTRTREKKKTRTNINSILFWCELHRLAVCRFCDRNDGIRKRISVHARLLRTVKNCSVIL